MTKLRTMVEYMRDVIHALVLRQPVPEPMNTDEHVAVLTLTRSVEWARWRGWMVVLDTD